MSLRCCLISHRSPETAWVFTLTSCVLWGWACVRTRIHHHGVTQCFHCPEHPPCPPVCPCLPVTPGNHRLPAFPRVSYSRAPWHVAFHTGVFPRGTYVKPPHPSSHGFVPGFLLALSPVPLSGWSTVCVSIPTEGHLPASRLWQQRIKLL